MMLVLILMGVLLACALVALLWLVLDRRRGEESAEPADWLERVWADRVVVHSNDSHTYDGLMLGSFPDGILMTSVTLVDQDTKMAGDVFVPRGMIAAVQRVDGGSQ